MAYKTIPKNIRIQVWNKYNHRCAYCGKIIKYEDMQVDHINPIYRGWQQTHFKNSTIVPGTDDISNYNPSCRSCNFRKGTMTVDDFRKELHNQWLRAKKTFQVRQSLQYGLIKEVNHPIVFYFENHPTNHKKV